VDFTPEFTELIAQRRADLRRELSLILANPGPITWEIGCGHGHFLERYAREFPEKTCVGVDLRSDRITRALRKAVRGRLANCHFVRTEALEFLHALPAGVRFDEIWVLFPDPWPKKRHHKNRLLQPEFFEAIASRAVAGTHLYFRTDHAEYFQAVASFLPSLATWQPAPASPWPLEHQTVFQARAPSYQSLIAVRTSHPATAARTVAPGLPPREEPTSPA
jgi:tRNA (guanine-N7-)-methyltransferase